MDVIFNAVREYFPLIADYPYVVFALASLAEGLSVLVFGGMLIAAGKLDPLPTFIIAVSTDFLKGYFWYWVGYVGGSVPRSLFGRTPSSGDGKFQKLQSAVKRYSGTAVIAAKLTYSVTNLILALAGSIKYNIRKFSWINFVGSLGWATMTLTAGYFFGKGYQISAPYLDEPAIQYAVVFIIMLIVAIYSVRRFSATLLSKILSRIGRNGGSDE